MAILIEQGRNRIQELLPVRYARMRADPFAFLRGAAAVMAIDLEKTPSAGIRLQACGDAHLANFGTYATPEGGGRALTNGGAAAPLTWSSGFPYFPYP